MRERLRLWAAGCGNRAAAARDRLALRCGHLSGVLHRHRGLLAVGAAVCLLFALLEAGVSAGRAADALEAEIADLQRQNAGLRRQVDDGEQGNAALVLDRRAANTARVRAEAELTELREAVYQRALWLYSPLVYKAYDFPGGIVSGGAPATLTLEMLSGSYDLEDGFWNSTWSGQFQFRVRFEGDGEEDEGVISGPFGFGFDGRGQFEFLMRDYNRDGEPDFALGQWGALSAGDYYGIFTVRQSGVVELLPFAGDRRRATAFGLVDMAETDHTHAFFYPHDHSQAMLFDLLEVPGFSITYRAARGPENVFLEEALEELDAWLEKKYARGELMGITYSGRIRDVYEWREDCFVLVRQELLDLD